ncbi:MAG TPA: hypothetical protein VFL17_22420 [Anaerolineae bacterium]|nr:hypothetical protein [Anaerolineae bacterium]
MSRTIAKIVFILASALAIATAHAHGDAPAKHGGIVKVANDITFELVVKPDAAELYLDDHGAALATAGMRGKLTVLNGTEKSEVDLKPAGDNRLEAKGVKIDPGAKVIAAVSSADGKSTMSVRFAIARSTTP